MDVLSKAKLLTPRSEIKLNSYVITPYFYLIIFMFIPGLRFFRLYRQFKAYNDERLNPALYKHKASKD